jgi:hypothetical protein
MSKLLNRGLIPKARGGFAVTDPSGLEAEACECYGTIREMLERVLPYAPSCAMLTDLGAIMDFTEYKEAKQVKPFHGYVPEMAA